MEEDVYVVKMDSKGRIVIPKDIRVKLGLKAGSRIQVLLKGSEVVLKYIK
ncbi:MAG: hypothetical protein DRJ52_01315 [Thermoprotei archaeon]|nr:MAG: hypothetical protein DRJ52_01315 [Thermoprotei archaeon]RLF01162.1 MAG: hypothetical protein DRJ63_00225 [Thermoprotei archaeon]HDI75320.1 AbrB/MazE/SpoVT family DNA-binding domain-containing protein [Thermoprotei archaeon]